MIAAIDSIRTRARQWWQREAGLAGAQLYLGCVIAAGACVLAVSMHSLIQAPPDLRWLVLVVLTIATGQLMLRMPDVPVSFSISEIFTFMTALLFGPDAATVVVAIEAAILSAQIVRSQRSPGRYFFNVSAAAIAMSVSARAFFAVSGSAPFAGDPSKIISHAGALVVFALLYFALNTGLVARAVALAGDQPVWHVWRTRFISLWPGYLGGASASGLALFLLSAGHGDFRVLAFVMPTPFILYVTFKTAVARMQDDVAHLTRINSMYVSTIETLAQAVDARDEITHDHLRRVQTNAMRLARELNITDDVELRALEAGALLHDVGKLAIPEHILNKPDKLTRAEFDTMKMHATIGAEILSPIDFPFPVLPIVRHHHENWDGSGYPDGLRGEQIPIGARILSVVDCFDALTSDRPYRRALTQDRALGMILERSGIMYDPTVVAALLRIWDEVCGTPPHTTEAPSVAVAETIVHARQALRADDKDPAISATTITLAGQLGALVGRHANLPDLCIAIEEQLSAHIPGLTIALYQYDSQMDVLFVRTAAGVHARATGGLMIGLGLRLTGWVGAHRTTIVNSEAALDLGNLATELRPSPQLCLSTPIVSNTALVGVLTVYSTVNRPFVPADVALFEMLAALLAPHLARDAAGAVRMSASSGTVRHHGAGAREMSVVRELGRVKR